MTSLPRRFIASEDSMNPHTQELSGDSSVDPLARLGRHARRPAIATLMLLLYI